MTIRRRVILLVIILVTIAIDQQTKMMARASLMNAYPRHYASVPLPICSKAAPAK